MPHQQLYNAIVRELPGLRVSADGLDRAAYARDTWPLMQIRLQDRRLGGLPGVVVWPQDTAEVQAVYRFASARRIPVTPIGAGSGVCGGAVPEENGIVLDLKALTGPVQLIEGDGLAEAGAGWIGQSLEDELNRMGVTAGHFPSSIMCSTLGGWLAARGAGQLSTRYGKFEDRVRAMEWVYPDGHAEWVELHGWGEGAGELLMGSEGTLGVATQVRFRVDPLPERRIFRAFAFDSVDTGIEAVRRLMQAGPTPAVVRLYDPLDTLLARSLKAEPESASPGFLKRTFKTAMRQAERLALVQPGLVQQLGERVVRHSSMLILMYEGPADSTAWQAEAGDAILAAAGGKALGDAPGRAWFAHRYDVSFKQAALYAGGGFVDTMEVAFPWHNLARGYHLVRQAIMGDALILAHFSHVYPEGGSIYFTFTGGRGEARANEELYRDLWRRGIDAVREAGGTISHHHGIGLLKARWMADEWGPAYDWLRDLKLAVDPDRIANPGKLGL